MSARVRGRGTPGLAELSRLLSDRDREILRMLARHRFLSTRQVERLFFTTHTSALSAARTARRVLRRLSDYQLVDQLARRVGGFRAGSASAVWYLAPGGARLDSFASGNGAAVRVREPSIRFVDHALAIAEAHVRLVEAARSGNFLLTSVQIEQESWRNYSGSSGTTEWLKPDLAVVTETPDFEDSWFLEVDLGTEHPPTVIRKCRAYQRYRQIGAEQGNANVFPAVLWVTLSSERQAKLQRAISAANGLDHALFDVLLLDELIPHITEGAE